MINYLIEHNGIKKKELTGLKKFLEGILKDYHKDKYTVSILLTNDEVIKEYNKTYRGKDKPTDVLSFSFLEGSEFELPVDIKELGDIIISVDTMKRQAKEFEITEEEELARLSIHGILHLLGFDHERSEEDERIMFEIQDKYLERFIKERE
ncbi:MAG: rRNA maturation RNase YbeY [Brevinematales bacterium]|nr:rRNA maturation RNase YbeY [Brevinematales bacterium]